MRIPKKIMALSLALITAVGLCACGNKPASADNPKQPENKQSDTILKTAASFAYPSLDAHKDYYGWDTTSAGITETLFKMDNNSVAQPWLAESITTNDKTYTVKIKDKVTFSNGNPLTADMAVRNLKRAAEVNKRFNFLDKFEIKTVNEKTFTITTPEVYPTMANDLASAELSMLDLDNTKDFDKAPIGTGPFVIKEFIPEGDVTVARNDKYWNGSVNLAGAVFYYMQEDDPKQMAMENGEIDCYTSVTASALEKFKQSPDKYDISVFPSTRLQFYALNQNKLSPAVRQAINLTIDKNAIATYLKGTVSAATGPFAPNTPYGKVTVPPVDSAKAKSVLEQDGYKMGANGIYEKDGKPLTVNISYYAARSLDTIAVLMQEQLKAVGIDSKLTVAEDADATYVKTGDYDIALYCMIADKAGDPYYFIDSVLSQNSRWAVAGFKNDECEALIKQLQYETDTTKRADLANRIVQFSINDNAFGYIGLFNKTTVTSKAVKNYSNSPFSFYEIDATTSKAEK